MTDVNLDLLIAAVDRRTPTIDEIDRVRTAAEMAGELEAMANDLVEHYVDLARNASRSWADVGDALGVSRQAAAQRFVAPAKQQALQLHKEVDAALVTAKDAAIRHRHNYIGTEHLLIGLVAGENSAVVALGEVGVDARSIRDAVEARMSLGGSQAAARIPWTPYARRIADLAEQHAQEARRDTVSARDWLSGLLALNRGTAAEVLAEHGVVELAAESQRSTRKAARPRS